MVHFVFHEIMNFFHVLIGSSLSTRFVYAWLVLVQFIVNWWCKLLQGPIVVEVCIDQL